MRRANLSRGFTLIEVVVVLMLIGLAAALALPALLRPQAAESGLKTLVVNARETAIRRGETVFLRIGASGEWRIDGSSGGSDSLLMGHIEPFSAPLTLLVTPTGTCMLDVPSVMAAPDIQLDPLTCEIRVPRPAQSSASVP